MQRSILGFNTEGRNGKEAAVQEIKTAGPPAKLSLNADMLKLKPGQLAHIEIDVLDKAGVINPVDNLLLGFSLEGDGEIMGASSPDLNNALGFDLPRVYTAMGKALVIIKAGASAGKMQLTVFTEKLKPTTLRFTVE